jgi:hypothetical protein
MLGFLLYSNSYQFLCTVEYNKHKGREDQKYRDDDNILHEHIRIVNNFVRETNLIYRRKLNMGVALIKQVLQLEIL